MSVRTLSVPTGSTPPVLEVRNFAGSVVIDAVEGADAVDVRVEALDSAAEQLLERIELTADPAGPDGAVRVRVAVPNRALWRTPAFAVTVRTPGDTRASVAAAAADIEVRGRAGRLELTVASGDITVGECAGLHVRSASGDARIGTIAGPGALSSASGELHVGSTRGGLEVRTASGGVSLGDCAGDVSVTSASGDITVGAASAGSLRLKTVSGDVSIGVVPGLRLWLDLSSVSGRMRSELADDTDGDDGPAQLSLALRSVSGNLRIHRVATAPAA
jgi:Putative adhesin